MGIFSKFAIPFKSNKKQNMYLPSAEKEVFVMNDSVKYITKPYKTLALFDLNIEKPKYDGALPAATI